ncbi:hypothetical protein [Burkholderia gladioli]|uniref:hypothetical protein n=1 Tax=Burkholderia gladioli TaxID=28095 RepID=UPI0005C5B94B|nr:hypothetical protein [Burkholderia gladioli]MBW5280645.1 hypothetical protein [Burkholderia gladioli]
MKPTRALEAINFFMTDVQAGIGPLIGVLLHLHRRVSVACPDDSVYKPIQPIHAAISTPRTACAWFADAVPFHRVQTQLPITG